MENYRFDKDEFDLKEYAKVIYKRRRTIFNIILVCLLVSIITGLLIPQMYDVYAIVRIGSISKPLISKKQALYEIRNEEILDTISKDLKSNPYLYDFKKMVLTEEIRDTDLIKIKVKHADPALASRICNAIAEAFVAKNNSIYYRLIKLLEQEIERLKISRYITDKERLFLLQQQLAEAKNFAVIEQTSIPKFSFWLNLGYKVFVAIIFGLMLGLFIIFIQEFSR